MKLGDIACDPVWEYLETVGFSPYYNGHTCIVFDDDAFNNGELTEENKKKVDQFCFPKKVRRCNFFARRYSMSKMCSILPVPTITGFRYSLLQYHDAGQSSYSLPAGEEIPNVRTFLWLPEIHRCGQR